MGNASSYSVWVTITIIHKYFNKSTPFISLMPTPDTVMLLKRSGLLFRQKENGEWVIIGNENTDSTADVQFEFYMKVTDKDFYYYTDLQGKLKCKGCNIIDADISGMWKKLIINGEIKKGSDTSVEVVINSMSKYLEFCVFATNIKTRDINLKEESGKIEFTPSEDSFPGEQDNAKRFVSKKTVALQQKHGYSIGLWEKKENGDVLLSNCIPFPAVDSASAISPKDTVSSYFYF